MQKSQQYYLHTVEVRSLHCQIVQLSDEGFKSVEVRSSLYQISIIQLSHEGIISTQLKLVRHYVTSHSFHMKGEYPHSLSQFITLLYSTALKPWVYHHKSTVEVCSLICLIEQLSHESFISTQLKFVLRYITLCKFRT